MGDYSSLKFVLGEITYPYEDSCMSSDTFKFGEGGRKLSVYDRYKK